jgi:hypothetical protein
MEIDAVQITSEPPPKTAHGGHQFTPDGCGNPDA